MVPPVQQLLIVTNALESIFVAGCQTVVVDGGQKNKKYGKLVFKQVVDS